LFAGEQLVVGEHLPITVGLGDLHLCGHRQRHRPRRDHTHAEPGGGVHEDPAVALQIGAQSVQGVDHTAVHLDHAALQLGHVTVGQHVQQFGRTRGQPPGLQVDDVELLLDTQCPRHDASQFVTVIDPQSHRCYRRRGR
jgi:hypothetical protein